MESDSAGHSTTFASFPFHRASNTADPSAVMRSTVCVGGNSGASDGCGMSKGGIDGGAETVGLIYLFAGMSMCSTSIADDSRLYRQAELASSLPRGKGILDVTVQRNVENRYLAKQEVGFVERDIHPGHRWGGDHHAEHR